jgi:hypothetical protein
MIDLADVQLGQEIPIVVQATDGTSPVWPDSAPQLVLFNSAGTLLKRVYMPADPEAQQVGLFRLPLFLGPVFPAAGTIAGFVQWAVGGAPYSQTVTLRIIPGGDVAGQIIAMTYVRRPSSGYLIWQSDSGDLSRGTNPRSQR